jgi:hypothetical protein
MAPPGKLDFHPVLRMRQMGSIALLQPVWHGDVTGPSLTCDLETGSLHLTEHSDVSAEKDSKDVYGVLGLARLEAVPALVVITGIEQVCGSMDGKVMLIAGWLGTRSSRFPWAGCCLEIITSCIGCALALAPPDSIS